MKLPALLLLLIALAAASVADPAAPAAATPLDTKGFEGDFEFAEEEPETTKKNVRNGEKKRWIHDPSSDLCRPLDCKKREICLLEDAFTAVCVSRKELKRNGDVVVPAANKQSKTAADTVKEYRQHDAEEDDDGDEDVFYDTEDDDPEDDDAEDEDADMALTCKTCPVTKPSFLCGSDNRTYSSLCRLDYHNCVHRAGIRVACRGFCPCRPQQVQGAANTGGDRSTTIRTRRKQRPLYAFTPQDLRYDNKHYKYIKYTKYDDKEYKGGQRRGGHVSVSEEEKARRGNEIDQQQCSAVALQAMGNRLLDWFSVVMQDWGRRQAAGSVSETPVKTGRGTPSWCKPEARWMHAHLDSDHDGRLSTTELYELEHERGEPCLREFLERCDGGGDGRVDGHEWCRCFRQAERPCAAARRLAQQQGGGGHPPECDRDGFYRPRQCQPSAGLCWCVDRHGVEYANTRARSKPDCEAIMNRTSSERQQRRPVTSNHVDGSNDDDEDAELEGSGDL